MRVTKTTTINNSPKNQTQMERVMEAAREKERISDAGSIESERMEFLFSSHGDWFLGAIGSASDFKPEGRGIEAPKSDLLFSMTAIWTYCATITAANPSGATKEWAL